MKDPNFDIAFSICGFNIYWYAILLALGIAAAVLITDRRSRRKKLPKDIALDLCIIGVPSGVIGARLFACLSKAIAWNDFFDLTQAGLSFYGGILFASISIVAYLKIRKIDIGEMLDIAAPGVFLAIGIAKWGDFFNRTNYGPLVINSAHKWFPFATFGSDLKIHYATFFYEFTLCIILVIIYYALLRNTIHIQANRFLFMSFVYCLGRYCIDGIRKRAVMIGPISFDQACGIVSSIIFLLLILFNLRSQDPTEKAINPEISFDYYTSDDKQMADLLKKTDSSGLD